MWPDMIKYQSRWGSPQWDTPGYWEKREAREKLLLAKQRARKDRPRRTKRFKIAQKSRARNRSN